MAKYISKDIVVSSDNRHIEYARKNVIHKLMGQVEEAAIGGETIAIRVKMEETPIWGSPNGTAITGRVDIYPINVEHWDAIMYAAPAPDYYMHSRGSPFEALKAFIKALEQ
jgi:hypothetical protein